jgi:hypothetical protein
VQCNIGRKEGQRGSGEAHNVGSRQKEDRGGSKGRWVKVKAAKKKIGSNSYI